MSRFLDELYLIGTLTDDSEVLFCARFLRGLVSRADKHRLPLNMKGPHG